MAGLLDILRKVTGRSRPAEMFGRYYEAASAVDLTKLKDFRNDALPQGELECWLDRPDAPDAIARREASGQITAEQAEACRFWVENGYFVVEKLIDEATLDQTWAAYEAALADGTLGPFAYANDAGTLPDRKLDPHLNVPQIRALQRDPRVLAWTDLFFGRKTVPFQTIMGHAGSQQAAHSDSIHMTTYPLGFLVASWTAFEDIQPDSGPLDYYPGSHRLPYLLSAEAGIAPMEFKQKGYSVYHERYEPALKALCEAAGFKPKLFMAGKGDVLFWHANLVHGGSPRLSPDVSRKALVCHYFAERVLTYHDLAGNTTRLHRHGVFAPVQEA